MNSLAESQSEVNRELPTNLVGWGHDVMAFVRLQGNRGGRCQMCQMSLTEPLYVAIGRSGKIAGPICMVCSDAKAQRVAPVGDALPEVLR